MNTYVSTYLSKVEIFYFHNLIQLKSRINFKILYLKKMMFFFCDTTLKTITSKVTMYKQLTETKNILCNFQGPESKVQKETCIH